MPEGFITWMQNSSSVLEWIAVVFSLIYVFLAARQNIWCWLFGALSAAVSIVLFLFVKLYAESILFVFYVVVSLYGWYQWKSVKSGPHLPVVEWKLMTHAGLILLSLVGAGVIYFIFSNYSDAEQPLLDALTTSFSFMTTFLVARKVLSNWLYWVAIDAASVYLYWSRGLDIYALLMVIYTGMAVYGYLQWRKEYRFQEKMTKSSKGLG